MWRRRSDNKLERRVAEPQIAYGPPGSTGEENVSIIAAPIAPGFRRASRPQLTTISSITRLFSWFVLVLSIVPCAADTVLPNMQGASAANRMEELGTAEQAAQRFLSTTVAPEGSGREANLLSASSRSDDVLTTGCQPQPNDFRRLFYIRLPAACHTCHF